MAAVSLVSVAAQILGSIAQGSPGSVWEKIRCFGIMYACIHTHVYTCYVLSNPPIPSSRCKYFVVLRPVEILLHERGRPSHPPCNVL